MDKMNTMDKEYDITNMLSGLMFKIVASILVLTAGIGIVKAQHAYPNFDFSERNFKQWKLYRGPQQGQGGTRTINYIDISTDNATIPGNAFQFIYPPTNPSARLEDPNTCYDILRIPQGKAYSVRVGPLSPGGYGNPHGYKATYTFTVDPERPTLVYRFAFVQQFDHGSSAGNDPLGFGGSPSGAGNNATFWMQTLDANGEKVAGVCGNYRLYPGAASGVEWFTWNQCGEISNTPWMTDVIDLSTFAGQDITIEFNTMDCYTGFHMAYAYISPETYADDTISYYCPGTDAVVRGPYGFKTYSWQEVDLHGNPVPDGITQTKHNAAQIGEDLEGANDLIVPDPVPFKRYACTFTSYSGCSGKIIYEIRPDSIYAAYSWFPSINGCRRADFTDASHVALTERTHVAAWNWNFGDAGSGTLNTNSQQHPAHIFSTGGDFDVKLVTVSSFGCKDSITHTVSIENDPVTVMADFSFASNTCFIAFTDASTAVGGASISQREWDFGDDSTSGEQDPVHVYQVAGDYTVTLTAVSSAGCANTVQKTVTVTPEMMDIVQASFDFQQDGCMSYAFTGTSLSPDINSWKWNFGDVASGLQNTSMLQHPSHLFTAAGTYPVTLTVHNTDGCFRIVQQTVPVTPAQAVFDLDDGCEGRRIPFHADEQSDIIRYTWNFNDGSPAKSGAHVNHIFPVTGQVRVYPVTLTVTANDGCEYTSGKNITIRLNPKADFAYDNNDLRKDHPIQFTDQSEGANQWVWIFGDGNTYTNSDPAMRHVTHRYEGDLEQYDVVQVVYNAAGCVDTLHKMIYLNQGIAVANAFSPNADGNNDVFRLLYRGVEKLYDFRVYNRWGEQVFDAHGDIEAFWDGSYNGKQQPVGAYIYHVRALTFEGEEISLKGTVNLIR